MPPGFCQDTCNYIINQLIYLNSALKILYWQCDIIIYYPKAKHTTTAIDYIYYNDTTTITLLQLHYYDGFCHRQHYYTQSVKVIVVYLYDIS